MSAFGFISDYTVKIRQRELFDLIDDHALLSVGFIVLLIGSTIVSTLGLLTDSAAVVIGGMIISPLMWPLMKVAVGVLFSERVRLSQALVLLFLAVAISLVTSVVITFVSPIKFVNGEILARTNPTLIDIFVALAAGSVAAFAITHKRISENLAGIAVATSLMPPLNVSGIGLALSKNDVFIGGFLLFSTNVLSIILACLVTFSVLGIKRKKYTKFSLVGMGLVVISLILLTIPLAQSLLQTVTQRTTYQRVRAVLEKNLSEFSSEIAIESVKTTLPESSTQQLEVEAELLLPEAFSFTFNEQEALIASLEEALEQEVNLKLFLKPIVSVQRTQNPELNRDAERIKQSFAEILTERPSLSLQSFETSFNESEQTWNVNSVLGVRQSSVLTESDRQTFEQQLSNNSVYPVALNLELVSLVELLSEPQLEGEKMSGFITAYFEQVSAQIDVPQISIEEEIIIITLIAPESIRLDQQTISFLRTQFEENFGNQRQLQIEILRKELF